MTSELFKQIGLSARYQLLGNLFNCECFIHSIPAATSMSGDTQHTRGQEVRHSKPVYLRDSTAGAKKPCKAH